MLAAEAAVPMKEMPIADVLGYYRSPDVRRRIIEYCGGSGGFGNTCTAGYLVGDGQPVYGPGIPKPEALVEYTGVEKIFDRGVEVFRSLWDRRSMVALLDIDYQNPDFRAEALRNPRRVFGLMEPVFQCVSAELDSLGIDYFTLMTGQGYHFVWRVSDDSPTMKKLANLTSLQPGLEAKYRHDHPFTSDYLPAEKGRAHAGLALLMEYLVHRMMLCSSSASPLPIVTTGAAVGSRNVGREAISFDLSSCGDPLHMRYCHTAFSLYYRAFEPSVKLVCLPRGGQSWEQLLEARSRFDLAAGVAASTKTSIPESSRGTEVLLAAYLKTPLRRFHVQFESARQDEPADWPRGYDRVNLRSLPPCVALPLSRPNEALLKPSNLQNVARVLVSLGWHPRSVAGLIRSKYERDYGWGHTWLKYDTATRADFWVRLFCGLVADGVDNLIDFNCVSHQEKGFCPQPWCGHNLGDYAARLRKVQWS